MQTHQHPAAIGAPYAGGYYGGLILIAGIVHAIAWAPKAEGQTTGPWIDDGKTVPGAMSVNDSMANTVAMAEAGSELANWARGLSIGGHTDWCLPARDVLELGYRLLKPGTEPNYCTFRDGDNASSLPTGFPYTEESPVQTPVQLFQADQPEAFDESWYWSSTQYSADYAYYQGFYYGIQHDGGKGYKARARAVRLIQLTA